MMLIDLLLNKGYVLSMNQEREIFIEGAVAIDHGRILDVGDSEELSRKYTAKETIDCTDQVIMPGLIDAHGHAGHSLLKMIALEDASHWMDVVTSTYNHFVTDAFWYHDGRLAALTKLKAGITTGVSVMGSMPRADDPVFSLNHAKGYAETGVRDIVCVGPCNPPWPHEFSRWESGGRRKVSVPYETALETTEAVIMELNHANCDRTRVFVTPFVIVTSIYPSGATPPDKLHLLTAHDRFQTKKMREIAAKHKTRIHSDAFGGMIHMAAEDLENALLGPDVHLQHCTGLSFDEMLLLAKSGTHVSCSPWNEYALEQTPVIELLELGVTVAIGTDGSAPNSLFDLFAAMRKMQTIQQIARSDFYCLPSAKLIEMVTIDAAKCIGWDDELGSLEIGKKADVITVDMKQPHLAPLNSDFFIDNLVHFATGSDVRDVIVDGHILMRGRRVRTVDEEAVIEASTQESLDTIRRANLKASTKTGKKAWGQTRMY